jgi:putative transposase
LGILVLNLRVKFSSISLNLVPKKQPFMAHSKVKIWIHAILIVKYRANVITPELEPIVYGFIREAFVQCKCPLDCLNGTANHLHAQFLLNPALNIRAAMKQIKGASSYRINKANILPYKFAWQVGYGAFSTSESQVPVIRGYIAKQKEHHQKMTFEAEFQEFIRLHGLPFDDADDSDEEE